MIRALVNPEGTVVNLYPEHREGSPPDGYTLVTLTERWGYEEAFGMMDRFERCVIRDGNLDEGATDSERVTAAANRKIKARRARIKREYAEGEEDLDFEEKLASHVAALYGRQHGGRWPPAAADALEKFSLFNSLQDFKGEVRAIAADPNLTATQKLSRFSELEPEEADA